MQQGLQGFQNKSWVDNRFAVLKVIGHKTWILSLNHFQDNRSAGEENVRCIINMQRCKERNTLAVTASHVRLRAATTTFYVCLFTAGLYYRVQLGPAGGVYVEST